VNTITYPNPNPTDTKAYIDVLINIIKDENIDRWVSCSGVVSAIEDAKAKEAIEERTSCRCIQFDVPTTSMLHAKNTFMLACAARELPIPETHDVKSKYDALRALSASSLLHSDKKYILQPLFIDDVCRGSMTLLPLYSDEKTRQYVSRLPNSTSKPFILQQFIPGGEEYCTHALVVRGKIEVFCNMPERWVGYALRAAFV
jgi:hypothetical protein